MLRLLLPLACVIQALLMGSLNAEESRKIALESIEASPSLLNLTSLPSAIVNGSVNVITGDYCEQGVDDVVSGTDPYVLGHSYISSYLGQENLAAGWSFLHHHTLTVYHKRVPIAFTRGEEPEPLFLLQFCNTLDFKEPSILNLPYSPFFWVKNERLDADTIFDSEGLVSKDGIEHQRGSRGAKARQGQRKGGLRSEAHGKKLYLTLYDPTGGHLLFKTTYNKYHKERTMRRFEIVTKKSGYTNVMGGKIGAHTNIKNISIDWYKQKDRFYVTFGDGTVRIYQRTMTASEMRKKYPGSALNFRDYELRTEKRPNGNIVVFDYNDKHELTEIRTFNHDLSHKINWIKFDQKSTHAFKKHPSLEVTTSDGLKHEYDFKEVRTSTKDKARYSISKIRRQGFADTRFIYCPPSNQHKRRVTRKIQGDYFLKTHYYKDGDFKNCVRTQASPCGPKGEKVVTHIFSYHDDHTRVIDAFKNTTRYFWDSNKRLKTIIKCAGKRDRLMSEHYYYGDGNDEGRLVGQALCDKKNNPILYHEYEYDEHGNIITDSTYCRLSPTSAPLNLEKLKECDRITTRYEYSKDRFNLKIEECDPNGNYTYYEYVKGTNLLKAKFSCDKDEIKKREFFDYDSSANLIEHIIDDGASRDKNNLKHVTERHITRITPKLSVPHFGEPEEIEELYYDFDKKHEVLHSKTVHTFSKEGFIEKKKIYDQDNNSITYEYEYDDVGRMTYSKDPLGYEEHFTYDKLGRLTSKRGLRPDVTWYYEYDPMGRLVKETEEQQNGLTLVTKTAFDFLGRKTSVTDPQNNTTSYEYDALNHVTSIAYPAIYDHAGNKKAPKKSYSYKKLGTIVIETDENNKVTTTTFNALGQILQQKFADGTTRSCSYDAKGNVKLEIAPNEATSDYHYDGFNRLRVSHIKKEGKQLCRRETIYNSFHPIAEIDPCNEKTTYSYDYAGRKVSSQHNERKTVYEYDGKGRLARERTHLNETDFIGKRYKYDDLDRLIFEKVRDNNNEVCSYKLYGYDVEGNRISTIQNIDSQEALTQTSFIPHNLPEYIFDAEGHKTEYKYFYKFTDEHGDMVFRKDTIDARACTTEERFDTRGNLSQVLRYDPFGTLIARKELFYDPSNNLVRIQEYSIANGVQQKCIVALMSYGPNNRLEAITEAAGTPEEKVTRYEYNQYGQKSKTIFADGVSLHHDYDGKGRLSRYYSSDSSIAYSYQYDPLDRILSAKNELTNATTSRTYNPFGDITSETLENGLTLHYSYDNAGRVSCLTLPDNSKVAYSYSPAFMSSIARVDAQGNELYQHKILQRDLSGLAKSVQLIGSAGAIGYRHDKLGRCVTTNHASFTEEAVKFDPVGNLLELHTRDSQGKSSRIFSYDYLSQLTSENDHTYSYNSLYDRLSHDGKPYTVNSLHAVLSDSQHNYQIDPRGNRIAKDTIIYKYDALDRLTEANGTSYSYDAFHRRMSKDGTKYLYALDNEIGSVDTEGNIFELRLLGEGLGAEIGAAVAIELQGVPYAPMHDRQGNVVALLDMQGNVAESYRYDAFGNEAICGRGSHNPWRFSSKRVDPETGFVYFGRRYYDPILGKWLTQDPLGLKAGPNLYAYVLNCPMTKFDLYGLLDEEDRIAACGNVALYTILEFNVTAAAHVAGFFMELGRSSDTFDDVPLARYGPEPGAYSNLVTVPVEKVANIARSYAYEHAKEIAGDFPINPENVYQATNAALAFGTLALGVRSFINPRTGWGGKVTKVESFGIVKQINVGVSKFAGKRPLFMKPAKTTGSESVNSSLYLNKKFSQLESAQQSAASTRVLPDGRIRYYEAPRPAISSGPTKEASYVTEFNPLTGKVRSWNECYDHAGKVNRVHPKDLNGQKLNTPHYPPTKKELNNEI